MEQIVNLHIEKLPEGFYLATSEDIQGLVVQAQTITEILAIAQDVAKQLLAAQAQRQMPVMLKTTTDSLSCDHSAAQTIGI